MRHWQPMGIISKWKLRDMTSTVTLMPFTFSSRVSGMHTILQQRCMKRTPKPCQRLSNWWRSSTQCNRLQVPCHPIWWTWCQTMTDVLLMVRKVILATTALMCSATTVMALVISSRTAQTKFPQQEHLITMIDHTPTHIMITTAERNHSLSITDTAKETTLTGQDHTINLNATEAPVTTGHMHSTLYPPPQQLTIPIHQQMLQETLPWEHPTPSQMQLINDLTFSMSEPFLQLVHCQQPVHSRHSSDTTCRSHTWKTLKPHLHTKTPMDPSIRRRSLFMTCSQTLPQNQMTIQML